MKWAVLFTQLMLYSKSVTHTDALKCLIMNKIYPLLRHTYYGWKMTALIKPDPGALRVGDVAESSRRFSSKPVSVQNKKKSAKGKILKLRCLMQHPKTKEIIFRYFPPGFQLNVRFSNFTVLILQNLIDQKVSVFPWQIQRNPHNPSKLVTRIIVMIKLLEKCVTEIYFISGKTQPEVLA